MASDKNSLSSRAPTSRRSFVKGLGAAGAVLPALSILTCTSSAEDTAATVSVSYLTAIAEGQFVPKST